MTATICGHDRDELAVWLRAANAMTAITPVDNCVCSACSARNAVLDPATLAELIAARLRAFDIGAGCHFASNDIILWEPRAVNGHGRLLSKEPSTRLTMPQARAILLALLQLPNAAREQAERVIRGER